MDWRQLARAVRGAARGEAQIDPSIASSVLAEFQRLANAARREVVGPGRPGAAEETILRLLTEGLTNAGIGARLHLREGTIKNMLARSYPGCMPTIRRGLLELG